MAKEQELRDNFPLSHEACDAFWEYWKENGETHKHGYYESTWGAIKAYLEKAGETQLLNPEPDNEADRFREAEGS
jgi:hypothetical protein